MFVLYHHQTWLYRRWPIAFGAVVRDMSVSLPLFSHFEHHHHSSSLNGAPTWPPLQKCAKEVFSVMNRESFDTLTGTGLCVRAAYAAFVSFAISIICKH